MIEGRDPDRERVDVAVGIAIQEEIARAVVAALQLRVSSDEAVRLRRSGTTNSQAFEMYLRGRQYVRTLSPENQELARQMFKRAIALDPGFALPRAGLADADSTECNPDASAKVIYKLRDLLGVDELGGTMRLGTYACELAPGSLPEPRGRQRRLDEIGEDQCHERPLADPDRRRPVSEPFPCDIDEGFVAHSPGVVTRRDVRGSLRFESRTDS